MIAMACGALLAMLGPGAAPERRAVVLTTDCGAEVDDQWAVSHLALSPAIDLKGVVTNHAPNLEAPASETSARIVRRMLDRLPLKDTPRVIAGASGPLADARSPSPNAGVAFLLEQSRGHGPEDRLVVVCIGTATDVASALLTDPTWADRVEVVAMGFENFTQGGDPWNVKNDPKAWGVLLESKVPLVVGDAAVCKRDLGVSVAEARELLAKKGPAGVYLAESVADWVDRHRDLAAREAGRAEAWPIWDEITTAYLLGLAKSEDRPRPHLRADLTFDHSNPSGQVRWITSVDSRRLWADLAGHLDRRD
jgi:inosine-uridine nucleoside N-ribohydrolase